MRVALGLDDAVPTQFLRYAEAAAVGNFGVSYRFGQPVAELLRQRFPATLELTVTAMLVAIVAAITLTLRHRPGLKAQNDLFTDAIGHARPPLQALVAAGHDVALCVTRAASPT